MPSWNIHTAHVERLLREQGAEALGVRDWNAFLLGNLAPDIYVGYMVPDTTLRIDYKLTHHSIREHIPLPRYDESGTTTSPGTTTSRTVTLGRGRISSPIMSITRTPAPTWRASAGGGGRAGAHRQAGRLRALWAHARYLAGAAR